MIDRLSPRTMILVTALAVLLIGLVGWFLFVSPERSEASALQQQIGTMKTRLAIAEKISEDANKEERAVELRRLETAMPLEVRVAMPQVLRQLSDAARKAHVRIRGVTPQVAVPLSGYQVIPIALIVDGHYFAVANFLELLRSQAMVKGDSLVASGRLYSVDSIVLGAGAGSSDASPGEVGATLSLNAFSYLGAPAAPLTPTETPDTTGATAPADG